MSGIRIGASTQWNCHPERSDERGEPRSRDSLLDCKHVFSLWKGVGNLSLWFLDMEGGEQARAAVGLVEAEHAVEGVQQFAHDRDQGLQLGFASPH